MADRAKPKPSGDAVVNEMYILGCYNHASDLTAEVTGSGPGSPARNVL